MTNRIFEGAELERQLKMTPFERAAERAERNAEAREQADIAFDKHLSNQRLAAIGAQLERSRTRRAVETCPEGCGCMYCEKQNYLKAIIEQGHTAFEQLQEQQLQAQKVAASANRYNNNNNNLAPATNRKPKFMQISEHILNRYSNNNGSNYY
jgi:hypothetical protein